MNITQDQIEEIISNNWQCFANHMSTLTAAEEIMALLKEEPLMQALDRALRNTEDALATSRQAVAMSKEQSDKLDMAREIIIALLDLLKDMLPALPEDYARKVMKMVNSVQTKIEKAIQDESRNRVRPNGA